MLGSRSLRGVSSRATFVLPSLYFQWGAQVSLADRTLPYWQRVQAAQVEYASLQMMSLAGFIVALSLLIAASTYTYRTTMRVAEAADRVVHTQEVRAALAFRSEGKASGGTSRTG